jgi:hypothetical protein
MPAPDGVFYDGDFTVPTPIGTQRVSYPLANDSRALVMRQRFGQLATNFTKLPSYSNWTGTTVNTVMTAGPTLHGLGTWLVGEEDQQDEQGGDYITWDRVYAAVPQPRWEPVTHGKNFQSTGYQFSGDLIVTMQIYSWSAPVNGDAYFTYFRAGVDAFPAIPGIPFVQIFSLGALQWIEGFNGFPTTLIRPNPSSATLYTLPFNNFSTLLVSGEIGQYMGNIFYRKLVYA